MQKDSDKKNQMFNRKTAKWAIGVIAASILIYLGIRHANVVAFGIAWVVKLIMPLILGVIMALILNVPMRPIESLLFPKSKRPLAQKLRRPLSIALSLILVFGIFIGVAFLVLPEFGKAVKLIAQTVMNGIDQAASWERSADLSDLPYGNYLSQIDIDWTEIKYNLEQWTREKGGVLMGHAAGAIGSIAGSVINFCVGLVFSIYILAEKETLKSQAHRLIRAWLPKKTGAALTHVASVCKESFHLFIAGQATDAFILGSLCTIGMLILRLPYAPTIGALVAVTAIIPIVGAFIGTAVGTFLIFTVNPFQALVFVIFLLILQQIEGNLIYPRVVGAKINLPAMWVLAAVTIGGNLAGAAGMLLGVPAASAAYALLKEETEKREQEERENGKYEKNKP